MNPVAIILGALSAGEAIIICFLLYTMNKIIEKANDWREPVKPIDTNWEEEYERDE